MSVPKMVDFKFEDTEGTELPDSNIDLEELIEEEDILENPKELIKFEEKEKIVHDEIFDCVAGGPKGTAVKKEKPKEDILPTEGPNGKEEIKEEPPPAKPVKKKRKPLSEEHKAKLAISRAKALEVRRAKAAERKKMKELELEEKELLKTQKIKKVQKLKEEVSAEGTYGDDIPKEEKRVGVVVPDNGFLTKKDLEQAQLDTLMKYESLRKARKEEKKKAALVEAERNKMLNTINRAVGGQAYKYRDGSNIWDRCY